MNSVKDMLKAGKAAIGTTASVSSPVEFLADAGFDFILFDTQHSPVEIKELQHQLKAMRGKKASPIIRVGANEQDQICYALDIGARGIIVPMVNTKQETIDMVNWCKYPPDGKRSSAGMRGEWGEFDNYREYMDAVNEELLIIPMIETMESLSNIDGILSVPGVDVLLVGPSDLSINLDIPLDYLNPKYQGTLDKIVSACENAGVISGMYFIPGGQDPSDFVERGFKFFTLPWSKWATTGIKNGLASIKR
ncbi:MAG: aldolase/citrate lyase family protein [Candidatus Bathyarchaeota archaeon]|nr:aldolase/citrate lyase family protein [Candidatus Bathyarchaeota archaeon]